MNDGSMHQLKYITLYNALNYFINLSRKDYFAIEERLVGKRLENKEYFLNEGEIIRYMQFINTRLMENYHVDYNGEFMSPFPWRPDQTSKDQNNF